MPLILNQFFCPDESPTSVLATDVVGRLVSIVDGTTVICSENSYSGSDDPGQSSALVIRTPAPAFSRGACRGKVVSYTAYFAGALFRGLMLPRHDVVVCLSTPPLLALVGCAIKFLRGSRLVIWEMDLYPDIAVDLGVFKPNSLVTRTVAGLNRFARNNADAIIALGPCMRDRLIADGAPAARIHIAENWADGSTLKPVPPRTSGPLRILYSGNLGLAHDFDTIFDAMLALRQDDGFEFIFAGDGPLRPYIEQRCAAAGLNNVSFRPFCPKCGLAASLASADIGLVTQRPSTCGSVVPSKMYGILAVRRPILYIGPSAATPAINILRHRCGWHVNPGDSESLVLLLRRLAAGRSEVVAAGANARAAFEKEYDLPMGVERVCRIITTAASAPEPERPWRFQRPAVRRTLMALWISSIILVIFGSLLPERIVDSIIPAPSLAFIGFDKIEHFSAYLVLALFPSLLFSARRPRLIGIFAMLALSGALEVLQSLTVDRIADPADMLSNSAGVLTGAVLIGNRARRDRRSQQ